MFQRVALHFAAVFPFFTEKFEEKAVMLFIMTEFKR